MATQTAQEPAVHPALLFMPDISGFTDFVSQTEILHAQSIIQEVLEVIIESNQLHLEVGEIEGDAVFFYRLGDVPPPDALLEQVKMMFTRFHTHLKQFDQDRICPCGACVTARDLKLKILAHYGEVSQYRVKDHQKLFGKDVIIIHRLLKNNLDKKEYALFTQQVLKDEHIFQQYPLWCRAEHCAESYDVGNIQFKVIDLTPLHQQLPSVQEPVIRLSENTKVVFSEQRIIDAPMVKVFSPIFDLQQRMNWMEGVKAIEVISKDPINRVGTLHRCVVNRRDPIIVTEKALISENKIELIEMVQSGMGGCRYVLESVNAKQTLLRMETLVKNKFLPRLFFGLFLTRKVKGNIKRSMDNLQKLVGSE
jgi:Protein of unknown function (DUF2652)